jgi:hypothetical protein
MPAVAVPAESAAANPVPAVPAPADSVPVSAGCCVDGAISTDSSHCYGFEHEAHEYCSNESITTWIWIRGPAPAWSSSVPTAASVTAECASGVMKSNARDVVPALSGAKKLHSLPMFVTLMLRCRERRSCTLPELALSLLMLFLLLLRCRHRRN